MNRKITLAIASTLFTTCFTMQSANAGFQAQDPRSLGMGGVGVAAANSAQAQFYNPSLLVSAKKNEDFNIEIPVTIRIADPTNLVDSLTDFAENSYLINFSRSLDNAIAAINSNNVLALPGLRDTLIETSKALQTGFNTLSGKSLVATGNRGLLVSQPSNSLGWAAYINNWADGGARIYLGSNDNQTMTDFITALSTLTITDPLLDPTGNLDTLLSMEAVIVQEFGVSLAIPYKLNNYNFNVGLTPKIMQIKAFRITQLLADIEESNGKLALDDSLSYTSFNMDFGISKQLDKNWTSGLMIKNIIPQSFKMPSNNNGTKDKEAKISHEIRIGTSYQNNWATIAADLDITQNTGPASRAVSQYLAIGTELDIWLVKLRLGYRTNLASANNNTLSAGLGLYLFGLNIDAAVAGGEGKNGVNEINYAAQLGIQW